MKNLKKDILTFFQKKTGELGILATIIACSISLSIILKDEIAYDNLVKLFDNSFVSVFLIIISTISVLIPFIIKFLSDDRIHKDRLFNKKIHDSLASDIRIKLGNENLNETKDSKINIADLEKRLYNKIRFEFEASLIKKIEEKVGGDILNNVLNRRTTLVLLPLSIIQKNTLIQYREIPS